jgi:hypothetical protein
MRFIQTILYSLIVASVNALPTEATETTEQTSAIEADVNAAQSLFDCLNRLEPHGASK